MRSSSSNHCLLNNKKRNLSGSYNRSPQKGRVKYKIIVKMSHCLIVPVRYYKTNKKSNVDINMSIIIEYDDPEEEIERLRRKATGKF